MKPGPKGDHPHLQALKSGGNVRPDRKVVMLFDNSPEPEPELIMPPPGMTEEAVMLWNEKVARYQKRGQKISGFEGSLRIYCEAEADLLRCIASNTAIVSQYNAVRGWANEFFDTPAAQRVKASGPGEAKNKFARNGSRPGA